MSASSLPKLVLAGMALAMACRQPPHQPREHATPPAVGSSSATPRIDDEGPIRMEALDPSAKPPMFVMRGGPRGPSRMAFLHGMCGHGLIGVVRTLEHLGRIGSGRVEIDTPVGPVSATLDAEGSVTIRNVPARLHRSD